MTTSAVPATATQVYQLYINAPQEQVWDAITNPDMVAKFFHAARVEATYEVGTVIRSTSADGATLWGENIVLECDPPRRLVHSWASLYDPELAAEGESRVTWEVEAMPGDVTRLTLIHDQLEHAPKTADSVRGWTYILSNLKTVLETGQSLPSVM